MVDVLDAGALGDAALAMSSAATAPGSVTTTPLARPSDVPAGTESIEQAARDITWIDSALAGVAALGEAEAFAAAVVHLSDTLEKLDDELKLALLTGIRSHPLDWSGAFVASLAHEAWSMVSSPFHLLVAVGTWTGELLGCVTVRAGLGWAEMTAGEIVGPGAMVDLEREICRPYGEVQHTLVQIQLGLAELATALSELVERPLQGVTELLELLTTTVRFIGETLSEDGALRRDLLAHVADSRNGGTILGAVAVNVGMAIIPGGGEIADAATVASKIGLAAEEAETTAQLAKASGTIAEAGLPEELLPLIARLRSALHATRLRMVASISDRKFQIFRKLEALSGIGNEALLLARERVYAAVVGLRGRVGRYGDLRNVVAQVSDHSQVIYLLELERQGVASLAAVDTLAHSATLGELLLEAAHLIDARFFEYFSDAARALLGWSSERDMPAVLATASEHRRSWPRYFRELDGQGSLPSDLNELRSITAEFNSKLIKVDRAGRPLPNQPTPADGAVFIGPDTPASTIVRHHLELWQARFAANNGVAHREAVTHLLDILQRLTANGL